MKTYVTFGQSHVHSIDGRIFDKDCVGVINCKTPSEGRELAFSYFGPKFCFEYPEDYWDEPKQLKYFPRGYIEVNPANTGASK